MVTAEAAIATLSLGAVTALVVCLFGVLAAQLRVNDLARSVARAAAVGAPLPATGASQVTVTRGDSMIEVAVRQTVALPVAALGSIDVSAEAVVLDETALGLGSVG